MFKGGIKEAAKILMGLGPAAQKKLLKLISLKDPIMAQKLEKKMVSIEDLQYLTPSMLVGLLRDVDLELFGVALRGVDQEITSKLLEMLSAGIRLDIEDGLKGRLCPLSEVEQAQEKILEIMILKIEKGHIHINPRGDKLV